MNIGQILLLMRTYFAVNTTTFYIVNTETFFSKCHTFLFKLPTMLISI